MGKLESFAAGPCCIKCKTSAEICAKRYSCAHHLRSLNTIAERRFESRVRLVGMDRAVEEFQPGRLGSDVLAHLTAMSVDQEDATEWAIRQVEELKVKYPDLSDESMVGRFVEKAAEYLAGEPNEGEL